MIEALLVDMLPAVMNRGPGGFWACAWSLSSVFRVCVSGCARGVPLQRATGSSSSSSLSGCSYTRNHRCRRRSLFCFPSFRVCFCRRRPRVPDQDVHVVRDGGQAEAGGWRFREGHGGGGGGGGASGLPRHDATVRFDRRSNPTIRRVRDDSSRIERDSPRVATTK